MQPPDQNKTLPSLSNQTSGPRRGDVYKQARLSDATRNNIVACLGEFVGTFMFLFMAFAGTQVANNVAESNPNDSSALILISLSFGFSLMANVWAFYRVSGGLFNPAVSWATPFGVSMVVRDEADSLRDARSHLLFTW